MVNNSKKWYQYEAVWHVLFWLLYLLLRLFVIQLYPGDFGYRLAVELVEIPLKMVALYFAIYVLIRQFLLQKKHFIFGITLVVYVGAIMFLNRVEDYYIIYPFTGSPLAKADQGFWSLKAAFVNLVYVYPVIAMGSTVYFVKSWFENQMAKEKLAREKAEIELKSLKDQIHPHFLFNTLNNIYSLTLIQSAKTPDMMLRLSKLLSYMIYESNSAEVPLARELQALKDYIELERLRLGDRLELSFDVSGPVERVKIAPLLLFPLLENCFKHGSHRTSDQTWISFHLQVTATDLHIQLENSLPDVASAGETTLSGGLGLQNVKKRLELLYPKHELRIHSGDTYLVNLKITSTWFDASW